METTATAVKTDELEWIALAKQGDRQAFGELVRMYQARVVGVVYRMCGDVHLAEDAAQTAFIRVWQNLHRYQPRSSFRSWLFRIATNAALDMLRRERDMLDVEEVVIADNKPNPERHVEGVQRAERIRLAVLALPESSRAALVLREYEQLSYREIADVLGIPVGTVMSRLSYARKKLVELLTPYLEES